MKAIIKNSPLPTFGVAGNRGVQFPVVGSCIALQQPVIQIDDIECYLVKEEDGFTSIYMENNFLIGVDCQEPIEYPCYLITNKSGELLLLAEQDDDYVIFCDAVPEPDVPYIALQEDGSTPVLFDPFERKFNL